ncbi:MAG: FAD-binding protein [Steroidobacteraceae bacterium]
MLRPRPFGHARADDLFSAAGRGIIARKASILAGLRAILAPSDVIDDDQLLRAYETDALTGVPSTSAGGRAAAQHRTGCRRCCGLHWRRASGSCRVVPAPRYPAAPYRLPTPIVVGMGRFNRILEIDYDDRCVIAQSGVTNLAISQAVAARNFYYAPTLRAQIACTIAAMSPRIPAACTV